MIVIGTIEFTAPDKNAADRIAALAKRMGQEVIDMSNDGLVVVDVEMDLDEGEGAAAGSERIFADLWALCD